MDEALAHQRLTDILELINSLGVLYDRRWGHAPYSGTYDALAPELSAKTDEVRARVKFAHAVVAAMNEPELASRIIEGTENYSHSFTKARIAIVEAIAVLAQREELAEVVGPVGPRLAATELNATIWSSAAKLWDDGHLRAAVQTAATALEGLLQGVAGPGVSGEGLGMLFAVTDPTADVPRLHLKGVDPLSKTWRSAHEGAAALVRGAFMGVRNLVSHPGWPEPSKTEAFEMISLLSYVANLVARSDIVRAP